MRNTSILVNIDVSRFVWHDARMPLPVLQKVPTAVECCAPLAQSPLSSQEAHELASRFKALADPARLRLLSLLLDSNGQEACTCDLTEPLGLSQPTVTHHLKRL